MKSSNFLKALSLSVATIALSAGTAHATTPIYTGGSTLIQKVADIAGQCVGIQNSANANAALATAAGCSAPISSAYEYLYAGVGSGGALTAFTTNNLTPFTQAATSANVDTTTNLPPGGSLPYPQLQLAFSDAPLDTPNAVASTTMYLDQYNANVGTKRGQAWQIPTTAVPIAIPYNLPTISFTATIAGTPTTFAGASFGNTFYGSAVSTVTVSNSASVSATVTKLDLNTDMLCYIWTGATSKGATVSGARTWDNPIFVGAKSTAKSAKITNADSNLNPTSVAGLPITTVRRSDGSGTTYLFTLWLSKNCAGYTAAGYSTPATNVTWPSFVTSSASGGGGLVTAVAATPGATGYITPDQVLPGKTGGLPAAFLAAGKAKVTDTAVLWEYPTPANTLTAETGVSVPTSLKSMKWGVAFQKKFFVAAKKNAGYPITGLTYVMGYSCYDNVTANDTYTGVKNYISFLNNPIFSTVLTNNGFAPLSSANYTAETGLVATASTAASKAGLTGANPTSTTSIKACSTFSTSPNL